MARPFQPADPLGAAQARVHWSGESLKAIAVDDFPCAALLAEADNSSVAYRLRIKPYWHSRTCDRKYENWVRVDQRVFEYTFDEKR
jgi:hypothetical protein